MAKSRFIQSYLEGAAHIIEQLNMDDIEGIIDELVALKARKGRLFILGVGGSAANASHAVNDFRKIAKIETYAPTDNVSEITARTNDDGWDTIFTPWLKTSHLNESDMVMVYSVGGGNVETNVSPNIVSALKYAQGVDAIIVGIIGRDGGYTRQVADVSVLIPTVENDLITPYAESFQALLWHCIVFHPKLKD